MCEGKIPQKDWSIWYTQVHVTHPLCGLSFLNVPVWATLYVSIMWPHFLHDQHSSTFPTVDTMWHLLCVRGRLRHLSTIDIGLVWCVYLRKGSSGGSYTRKEGVDGVFMQLLVVRLCPHWGTECNNKKLRVRLYICDLWPVATFPCVVKACPPRPNTIQGRLKYVHRPAFPFPLSFISSRRRSRRSGVKLSTAGGPPLSRSFCNHALDMCFSTARLASVIYFMPVNWIC